jgi:Caspase domain
MATTIEERPSPRSREDQSGSRANEQGQKRALIIGVSEYNDNDIQSLEFCRNDGEKIYETLKSISYKIPDNYKLVGHVQFETMRNAIYDFFDDGNTKADDTLVFYYSGHGIPDTDGDVYLATSEIDPDSPYRRGFSNLQR